VVEYTSGASSLRGGLRRAARTLLPHHPLRGRKGWSLLTPVVLVAAGILFTTSATNAKGTDLRDDRGPELSNLIAQRKKEVDDATARAKALRAQTDSQTKSLATTDTRVAAQRARGEASRADAGLTALHGPGITVKLNDAPRRADGTRPPGARPDDLVVHQQDVQAVVNALWAGGGEAMTIMGVRVISTSAVRCVGNTLLLDGRVFSPPFVVTAIGDVDGMQRALDGSDGVQLFREAAVSFGLGYQVRTEADVTVPAYDGSLTLRSAQPAG
jgi:uncharacterized protein YlxW (UPF0749 family)